MKKKLLLSIVGVASLTLGLSASKPVLAADTSASTTNQSQSATSTTNSDKKDSTTTNTTDTSKNNNGQSTTTEDKNKPSLSADTKEKPKQNNSNSSNAIKYLGKTVKLKKNAYVYDSKGKRIKNKKLKKGTILSVIGFTTVKNKSYLQISLNGKKTKKKEYVKPGNVKLFKVAS